MINAGTIAAYLTLDSSKFSGGLRSAREELAALRDKSASASDKVYAIGNTLQSVGTSLTKGVTVPLIGAGAATSKMAYDFEDAVAKVSTIADTDAVPIDKLKKSIMELSDATGQSATDIADNVYNAISAGQKTGDAVNFVSNATKLAIAGFTSSGSALDILTTIMNAYGLEANEVTKVSDTLITTQNLGKTTVDELSSSMGKIIPTAKANNVALDQVATGYAIMTANGVATAETTTYMNSMLNELGKSGTTVADTLKKKTGKSFSELMADGMSLSDVLSVIDEAAKENNLSLSDMFSSSEAAKAGLILLGDDAEKFTGTLEQMRESTGATNEAFGKLETDTYKMQKAWNQVKNAGIRLGTSITTAISPVIEDLAETVEEVTKWFSGLDEGTQKTILRFGLYAIAAGPVISTTGKITNKITSLVTGTGKLIKKLTGNGGTTEALEKVEKVSLSKAEPALSSVSTAASGAGTALGSVALSITGVLGVVGLLAGGMYLLSGYLDDVNAPLHKLGDEFSGVMEKAAGFKDEVNNSVSSLQGLDDELLNISSSQSAYTLDIENSQKRINEIYANASEENRELKAEEVNTILASQLFISSREAEIAQETADKKAAILSEQISTAKTMTDDEVKTHVKAAQDLYDKRIDIANQLYQDTSALLYQQHYEQGLYTDEQYATLIQKTQQKKDTLIQIATDEKNELLNATTSKYLELTTADDEFLNWKKNWYDNRYIVEDFYNGEIQKLHEKDVDHQGLYEAQITELAKKRDEQIEYYNNKIAESYDESMSSVQGTVTGILTVLAESGGEVDGKTMELVNAFMGSFDGLDDDARETMYQTIAGMVDELEKDGVDVENAGEGTAAGLLKAMLEELDINSPSKETEKIGQYAVAGLIQGMNGRESTLEYHARRLARKAVNAMKNELKINSPSKVTYGLGGYFGEGFALAIRDSANDAVIEAQNMARLTTAALQGVEMPRLDSISVNGYTPPETSWISSKVDKLIDLLETLVGRDMSLNIDGREFGRWVRANA